MAAMTQTNREAFDRVLNMALSNAYRQTTKGLAEELGKIYEPYDKKMFNEMLAIQQDLSAKLAEDKVEAYETYLQEHGDAHPNVAAHLKSRMDTSLHGATFIPNAVKSMANAANHTLMRLLATRYSVSDPNSDVQLLLETPSTGYLSSRDYAGAIDTVDMKVSDELATFHSELRGKESMVRQVGNIIDSGNESVLLHLMPELGNILQHDYMPRHKPNKTAIAAFYNGMNCYAERRRVDNIISTIRACLTLMIVDTASYSSAFADNSAYLHAVLQYSRQKIAVNKTMQCEYYADGYEGYYATLKLEADGWVGDKSLRESNEFTFGRAVRRLLG